MAYMKRTPIVILSSVAVFLALTPGSLAKLTEVGEMPETTPPTVASCPTPSCLVVSRTTGFQVKVGTARNPLGVQREGTIVAWTVSLGKPNPTQIKFFDTNEGGPASAGIAVLRPQKSVRLGYQLVAQGPIVKLEKYFGKSAQFPLETTIKVKKGDVIALTVPTWAPALALGFANTTSWRASRPKAQCSSTGSQTTQTAVGGSVRYYCLYSTARLTYSATLVSTP
ncbi:MAG TPA: hypothetical protein VGF15_04865 [Solirubrobacteraceae bacterium]|jgi:hypothetical protein